MQNQFDKKERDLGIHVCKRHCVASEFGKNTCHSHDALAIYRHECSDGDYYYDAFCWSCNTYISPEELAQSSLGSEFANSNPDIDKLRTSASTQSAKKPITKDEVRELFSKTEDSRGVFRGIRPEIFKFFGYRFVYDNKGDVREVFFPETYYNEKTRKTEMNGYKQRLFPKKMFGAGYYGRIGRTSQFSAQKKFETYKNHRDVLICGGEFDCAAAYQMLLDDMQRKGNGDYTPPAIISSTSGEGSTAKQCISEFDFLDQFENIILGLDNDERGLAEMERAIAYLPRDKVKIAYWTEKDPNQMLENGHQKQFIADFYNAKPLETNGILNSSEILPLLDEELDMTGITLPSYMKELQNMMPAGEFPTGIIANIIADTSVGKTSHVNAIVHHWLFNSPFKVGVVSLENTSARYLLDMISLHIGENFMKTMTRPEVKEYLKRPEIKERYADLFKNEDGSERWSIIDERDGDIKRLERQMERLVKKFGCRILVVDVLSDILRGSSKDFQEDHMKFQKRMVKSGVTIVNILHTNKSVLPTAVGMPTKRTEYDALGSSTFVQSAAINIVLNRNKMATNWIEKNSTYVDMPKCRDGITGPAGCWLYDVKTRLAYDRNEYFNENPSLLPQGYDLNISSFDKSYYDKNGEPKFKFIDASNEPSVDINDEIIDLEDILQNS